MPDSPDEATRFSWRAAQQTLGDGRVRIRVVGTWEKPAIGCRVTLTRSTFQPSNPNVLLLTFKAEPTGAAAAHPVPVITVSYEQTSSRRYKLVSIQPGGVGIAVTDEPS